MSLLRRDFINVFDKIKGHLTLAYYYCLNFSFILLVLLVSFYLIKLDEFLI